MQTYMLERSSFLLASGILWNGFNDGNTLSVPHSLVFRGGNKQHQLCLFFWLSLDLPDSKGGCSLNVVIWLQNWPNSLPVPLSVPLQCNFASPPLKRWSLFSHSLDVGLFCDLTTLAECSRSENMSCYLCSLWPLLCHESKPRIEFAPVEGTLNQPASSQLTSLLALNVWVSPAKLSSAFGQLIASWTQINVSCVSHLRFCGYVLHISEETAENECILCLFSIGSKLRDSKSSMMNWCLKPHVQTILLWKKIYCMTPINYIMYSHVYHLKI